MRLKALALALMLAAAPLFAESWTWSTIDAASGVGAHVAMATRFGRTHVAYFDARAQNLKYAVTSDDKTWSVETVDSAGNVGQYASIVVDKKGIPHIAYYDATNAALKYAAKFTSTWSIHVVDPVNAGQYTSIDITEDFIVYISYLSQFGWNLKCVKGKPGNWLTLLIDFTNVVGLGSSIALDHKEDGHISYMDYTTKTLKYAHENGPFDVYVLDPVNVAIPTAIAVDDAAAPHIAYLSGGLRYASNTSGNFVYEGVDSSIGLSADDVSIAVTGEGAPFITYHDAILDRLKLARKDGGEWTTDDLDSGGKYNAITVDEAGRIRIAYYRSGLRYAITE